MEKNFFFLCQKFTYSVTWTLGGFRSLDESTSTPCPTTPNVGCCGGGSAVMKRGKHTLFKKPIVDVLCVNVCEWEPVRRRKKPNESLCKFESLDLFISLQKFDSLKGFMFQSCINSLLKKKTPNLERGILINEMKLFH